MQSAHLPALPSSALLHSEKLVIFKLEHWGNVVVMFKCRGIADACFLLGCTALGPHGKRQRFSGRQCFSGRQHFWGASASRVCWSEHVRVGVQSSHCRVPRSRISYFRSAEVLLGTFHKRKEIQQGVPLHRMVG